MKRIHSLSQAQVKPLPDRVQAGENNRFLAKGSRAFAPVAGQVPLVCSLVLTGVKQTADQLFPGIEKAESPAGITMDFTGILPIFR